MDEKVKMIKSNESTEGTGNVLVRLRKNENSETLIKRFLKKMKKERLIEEINDRKKYKKPTTKRREAHHARLKILKKLRDKEKQELLLLDG